MLHWFFSGASSGSVVKFNNWNELVNHCYMSGVANPSVWGVSGQVKTLYRWSSNKSWYANSSNVRYRFPASSTASGRYADSSNVRYKFKGSSNRWMYVSSQLISGGSIDTHNISSQGKISGQWWTPIRPSKPTASVSNCGQIIRTSGSGSDKTYLWVCLRNSAGNYEWDQICIST